MNVCSQNIGVFPKIDSFSSSQLVKYVAHFGAIVKIIHIITPKYPNHICSISTDGRLKLWNLTHPYTCIKTLNLEYLTCDIIQGNNDCVLVSGEKIANIDLNNQKIIYIIQPKIGHFIEFSKITKINNTQKAISSSLNKFYLVFDINNGKILKKIRMNQVHFICWMEKDLREKKAKLEEEKLENKKNEIKEEEEEEDEEELADTIEVLENYNKKLENENEIDSEKKKKKKKKKIEIRDIGSALCLETKDGHKGYVTSMISINSKEFKNCIISGGFDNMIKIINIENNTITDLKGHNNTVISLCLVKNNYLYSGSLDHTFRKWNLELRQCENINEDHNSLINNICEMKDGLILTTGYDMKIRIWDNHLKNIKTFSYKNGRIDTCCSIGNDMFVFGNTKSDIYIKKIAFGNDNNDNSNETTSLKNNSPSGKTGKRNSTELGKK